MARKKKIFKYCCSCCGVLVALAAAAAPFAMKHLWTLFNTWKEWEMNKDNVCLGEQMAEATPLEGFKPLSWDEAYAKAEAMLAQMTPQEQYTLMQGRGWVINDPKKWWYTGNIPPIPRLGIPSMNMQDAAGGVRTMWTELVGTVTCWPSALAMGATWDAELVRDFASAMAKEFAIKGVNMVLGPSVQVHRVARNGRNFEYMSGEDPFLGSRLAAAYVEGVQGRGLMTSVKHWGFNEQETNRNFENSVVDEKTAWELYYPPFVAAIETGATAVMCGYNRVDGPYACGSWKQLTAVLRQKMGFRGFVQSDWWATHVPSVMAGLDQEMPGNHLTMDPWKIKDIFLRNCSKNFAPETLEKFPQPVIHTAVTRILAAMYRVDLIGRETCVPPCCEKLFRRNATSKAHASMARDAATASVVLLKNEGAVLPLSASSVKSIAVIGSAAVARAFDPAGSSQTFEGAVASWNTGDYYAGGGSGHVTAGYVVTPLAGISARAERAGIHVYPVPADDVSAAANAASLADVAIVVGATTSGEAVDRPNLNLDHGADYLIHSVARVAKKTIVLVQVPGAILMPWRESAAAIALMFLGGQETGNAWASILFGDEAPSGRLPLMIPATQNDTIEPGTQTDVRYTEGMRTSYRNPGFKAAYPFGFGLTYTTFDYSELSACSPQHKGGRCVELNVRNTGARSARTVLQLYLKFPGEAGYPAPILRGFHKTPLIEPGSSVGVSFHLSVRDLSYYDVDAGNWTRSSGIVASVGESAQHIVRTLAL